MAQDNLKPSGVDGQETPKQNALAEALATVLRQNNQSAVQQNDADNEDVSLDFVELFFHVLGKIHYIILAAIVGTLLAGLYVHFYYAPVYSATAKLYIQNTSGISVSVGDMQVASKLTLDYQEVFKTWEVQESIRADMPVRTAYWNEPDSGMTPYRDEEFSSHSLSVSNPSDTRVLYITVTHPRGEVAIEIANAYADHAMDFIMARMGNAYEPTEFSAAKYANTVGMRKTHYLLLGFMGGAGIVLAVLVLLYLMDDRPHTPDDITKVAGIPTLAVVPREQNVAKSKRRVQSTRKEGNK